MNRLKSFFLAHKVWFLLGIFLSSSLTVFVAAIFIVLTYGDPIGTQLQYLGSKLINAGAAAKIERLSPEEIRDEEIYKREKEIEELTQQVTYCEGHLEAKTQEIVREARKRVKSR